MGIWGLWLRNNDGAFYVRILNVMETSSEGRWMGGKGAIF